MEMSDKERINLLYGNLVRDRCSISNRDLVALINKIYDKSEENIVIALSSSILLLEYYSGVDRETIFYLLTSNDFYKSTDSIKK